MSDPVKDGILDAQLQQIAPRPASPLSPGEDGAPEDFVWLCQRCGSIVDEDDLGGKNDEGVGHLVGDEHPFWCGPCDSTTVAALAEELIGMRRDYGRALRERDELTARYEQAERKATRLALVSDEAHAAHASSFGALAEISLLTDLQGEVDDYSDVVKAVERIVAEVARLREALTVARSVVDECEYGKQPPSVGSLYRLDVALESAGFTTTLRAAAPPEEGPRPD